MMPLIVGVLRNREATLRKEYKGFKEDSEIKKTLGGLFTTGEDAYVTKKLRALTKAKFSKLKTAIAKPGGLGGASLYVRNMLEYRRISPDLRSEATLEFRKIDRTEDGKTITRSPDPTNARDLKELVIIAKKLREIYNK